ncbi:tobamovirus multiplication protein 2B isoform X3 [Nicotiana tabacum]|uniref:Tobamovirus multiplication protein 2B isoform X2 n=2 Tax=Nicotiana TaxID=4085 RepID=A0A1S4ADD1_TOBAC|nr:PREDICTED: tobamovirus multiplication protein 2B isoform X2 [Nicotiana sylvestris]XP_016474680.1 PREDICTED: tobamovirus multiplication protein 2B-like isoform X2 [Nicotiana tabacum]
MATSTSTGKTGGSSSSRDGSAKTMVADQITQSIQSTSNLLHLMLQSSPSQAELMKLPKTLFAKTPTIKNTELVLEQLPQVISALDAHMENGLQSVPQLKTVMQLLSNMENCQLKTLSRAQATQQISVPNLVDQSWVAAFSPSGDPR